MPSPQKVKGKSFENAKAKFLTEIYGEKFIRVPTSGAFLGGQNYDRRHTMSPVSYTHLTLPTTPYV